jgi:hypothetical protein
MDGVLVLGLEPNTKPLLVRRAFTIETQRHRDDLTNQYREQIPFRLCAYFVSLWLIISNNLWMRNYLGQIINRNRIEESWSQLPCPERHGLYLRKKS